MRLRIFTEPQQGATYEQLLGVARATERLGSDTFANQEPDHARTFAADGTPDEVFDRIREFEKAGAETVYLQYDTLDDGDHLEPIGREVLPRVGDAS